MKLYLGLESKSLWRMSWLPGLCTDSFGLGFGICGLTQWRTQEFVLGCTPKSL